MGTRGCVAVRSSDGGWLGVYNHFDSYPTGLGPQVWEQVTGKSTGELRAFALQLLHSGRWEAFVKGEKASPEQEQYVDSFDPDPLFIEWVYIVDPDRRTLTVLAHQKGPLGHPERRQRELVLRPDGYWDYGHCAYRHVAVATFDLDGPEPDWRAVETEATCQTGV